MIVPEEKCHVLREQNYNLLRDPGQNGPFPRFVDQGSKVSDLSGCSGAKVSRLPQKCNASERLALGQRLSHQRLILSETCITKLACVQNKLKLILRNWCVHAKWPQSCPTVCGPMDCTATRLLVHGIFQARILESGATPSSRGASGPTD